MVPPALQKPERCKAPLYPPRTAPSPPIPASSPECAARPAAIGWRHRTRTRIPPGHNSPSRSDPRRWLSGDHSRRVPVFPRYSSTESSLYRRCSWLLLPRNRSGQTAPPAGHRPRLQWEGRRRIVPAWSLHRLHCRRPAWAAYRKECLADPESPDPNIDHEC